VELEQELIKALDEAAITKQARDRYTETDSYHAALRNAYYRNHFYYAPPNNDQWPEDAAQRPGRIHITQNFIKPAVDTDARLEALLPRVSNLPDAQDPETKLRAEAAEKLMLRFLELSDEGWSVWLHDLCKVKAIYRKGILKPFWNARDKRPDVSLVENPGNLRIGWGSSDFTVKDWALYEYSISPTEAKRRWPDVTILPPTRSGEAPRVTRGGDHSDPLGTISDTPLPRQPSDYELKQVRVWDYWYKDEKSAVRNAVFCEGVLMGEIVSHPEYPEVPYIVIEHDHEPGSPEGMSMVEPLIDLQVEFNRALSHFAQLVADEIDPAWQVDSDSWQPGLVPHGGEILAAGEGKHIAALEKPVNQFPIQQLMSELYKSFHFTSGLSEVLFSVMPGAQTAGRALAVQIEASANRIEPRRNRLYAGIKELLSFWQFMLEKKNPSIVVGANPDGTPATLGLGDAMRGLNRWKFIAPEITPRDVIEQTTNVINQVQGKLLSLEDGMDQLGIDAPLEMKRKIEAERTNPALFPGDAQAYVAVMQLLQQLQMQQQQMQQAAPSAGEAAAGAMGQMQADAQGAMPTLNEQDNQGGPPQPMSQPGSPPPPGGPAPALANQTLIRSGAQAGGQAQVLQQVKV
jgi:hypothetical protein